MREPLTLESEGLRLGLSTAGGTITGLWTRAGQPLLRAGEGEAAQSACFPMLPMCNRVSGNAITVQGQRFALPPNTEGPLYLHGDAWLGQWQIEAAATCKAQLGYRHHGAVYHYQAQQRFALGADWLRVSLSVTNLGRLALPFGLGLHPYFPRDGAQIQFHADSRWDEAPDHLPSYARVAAAAVDFTTAKPLPPDWQNNVYEAWDGRAVIHWSAQPMALELRADPLFSALMLYSPGAYSDFFCLEPMSHLPDAVNRPDMPELPLLAPGAMLSGSVEFRLIPLEPCHD